MKLVGLSEGRPGQHLGISHTLKHYLAPAEVWEDLVTHGEESPWAALDALGPLEPPAWAQHHDPGGTVRELWPTTLASLYRAGYLAVLRRLAEALPEPHQSPWRPTRDGRRIVATDEGVVLVVAPLVAEVAGPGAKLITAYRPLGFTLKDHRAIPKDAINRGLRAVAARQKARRIVAQMAIGGAP